MAHGLQIHGETVDGLTPLHVAALRKGSEDVVRTLIELGSDPGRRTNEGQTPKDLAMVMGHTELVPLLERLAPQSRSDERQDHTPWMEHPAAKDLAQRQPHWPMVHVYAGCGLLEPLSLCVAASGLPDTQERISELTPLHVASIFGQWECASWLIEQGASLGSQDSDGATPLYKAVQHQQEAIASLLISAGANVNAANAHGDTILHEASIKGSKWLIEILVRAGGARETRDELGRTPLFTAAYWGNGEAVKALVKAKAAIDAEDNWGNTPLLQATLGKHFELARYIAERGGNPYHKGGGGNSPFDMAIHFDHPTLFFGIDKPQNK